MSPAIIQLLIQFGLQYGPEAVTAIAGLWKNTAATVEDVEAAFTNLKPYSAYGINPPAPVNVVSTPVAPIVGGNLM